MPADQRPADGARTVLQTDPPPATAGDTRTEARPTPNADPATGTVGATPEQERAAAERSSGTCPFVPGYEVERELGRGGMGVVYLARHVALDRTAALKMVLGEGPADEKAVIRFLAEAEAVAAIRHPNVVQVYEYGENAGRPFLALEYLPGGSLADRLKAERLTPRAAAALVARIAAGMAAAHELGIVHRDLKPANVLFDEHGEPKVTDFGLAKGGSDRDLTATQAVMGTPAYMSPEQARGKAKYVGPAADVWALGVILYECVARERPFTAESADGLLAQILVAEPELVRRKAPAVPRDLERVCRKCLEKEPLDRYPTARELADDLQRFLSGRGVTARPTAQLARWARRNPLVAGLVVLVFVMSLALSGSLAVQYRQALDRTEFEVRAKEQAEALARENADLAAAEAARRQEADRLRAAADAAAVRADRLRAEAAAEAERANEVSDFLAGMFRSSDPLDIFGKEFVPPNYEKLRGRTARDFLDDAVVQFKAGLRDQPLVRAKLLTVIGNSYRNLGEFAKVAPLLTEAFDLRKAHLPADHPDVTAADFALGLLALDSGDFFDAEARFRRVLDAQTRSGADPKARSITRGFLAWALGMMERPEAETILRDEIGVRKKLFGPTHRETLFPQIGLVAHLLNVGRPEEVLPLAKDLIDGLRAQPDGQFRAAADAVIELQSGITKRFLAGSAGPLRNQFLRGAEETVKASLKKAEAALPPVHIYFTLIRFELAVIHHLRGDRVAAEAEYKATLQMARQTCGLAHPKALVLARHYTRLLSDAGRADEARALFTELADANLKRFGPDNHWRPLLLVAWAEFEARAGAHDRAAEFARQALALRGKLIPTRATASDLTDLAETIDWGKYPELAIELFATARPLAAAAFGDPSPELCVATRNHGSLLYRRGKRADGAGLIRQAGAMADKLGSRLPADERVWVLRDRGTVARDRGEWADAAADLGRAVALARSNLPAGSAGRRDLPLDHAGALVGGGRLAEAVPVVEEYRKAATAGKPTDAARAGADRLAAIVRLAAGDADGYRTAVRAMAARYARSADLNALLRFTWAAGLGADPADWDPADAAARLAAALVRYPKFAWGHRGRALALVRAGDPWGAGAALEKVTGDPWPAEEAIRGLIAVARGDAAAAAGHLRRAEELTAAQAPSERNPFAYADTLWGDRLDAAILLDELRSHVVPNLAPAPREKHG